MADDRQTDDRPTTGGGPADDGPARREGRAELYRALHTLLLTFEGMAEFLHDLAVLAQDISDPPLSCGITIEYGGRPLTVSSSDALALALDEAQYASGDGPCLHAMRTGQRVWVPELDDETRWPAYVAHARSHGLRESLSLPLIVEDVSIGAVNLYSRQPGPTLVGEVRARADLFVSQASTALQLALRQLRQTEENTHLEAALVSRSVIDQALGIIMGHQRCTPEAAFDLLRQHSQNNNRPLREIAAELVARTGGQA